jgi:hypothetical protein
LEDHHGFALDAPDAVGTKGHRVDFDFRHLQNAAANPKGAITRISGTL